MATLRPDKASTDPADSTGSAGSAGEYRDKVVAVEPGGIEPVADADRHGRPLQLFWTWTSPNLEFATIFVGVLAVVGLRPELLVGRAGHPDRQRARRSHPGRAVRPRAAYGVPQMVLSRLGFGYWGNVLPAGLNVGHRRHRLVRGEQRQRRVRAQRADRHCRCGSAWSSSWWCRSARVLRPQPGARVRAVRLPGAGGHLRDRVGRDPDQGAIRAPPAIGAIGGFLLTFGAAFGYAAGWNPYASDYTRYLPPRLSGRGRSPGGRARRCSSRAPFWRSSARPRRPSAADRADDPDRPPSPACCPPWLADLTLLAIALGAVSANVLNIYSGALSFIALGIKAAAGLRRAIVALGVRRDRVLPRLVRAEGRGREYENFLLVIAYWIAPGSPWFLSTS